jgi:hypothetical protein
MIVATNAAAQSSTDPGTGGRFRLGPLGLSPVMNVTSVWDTNVLYSSDKPAGDLVTTASPSTALFLRMGRVRLNGSVAGTYEHYRHNTSGGGLSSNTNLRATLLLNRLAPYGEGTYVNTNQRIGYEIDARARQSQGSLQVGCVASVGGGTSIDVWARTGNRLYANEAEFNGVPLDDALDQERTTAGATVSQALTPLTRVSVNSDLQRDRFRQSPERDADSVRVTVGLESDALLKGRAAVGMRFFQPNQAGVQTFEGVVASADISTVLFRRTQLGVVIDRDVQFSYTAENAYYVQTAVALTVSQALGHNIRTAFRAGRQKLDYRAFSPALTEDRNDRGLTYGTSLEYLLGNSVRVEGRYDYTDRSSETPDANFAGRRYGVALGYIF